MYAMTTEEEGEETGIVALKGVVITACDRCLLFTVGELRPGGAPPRTSSQHSGNFNLLMSFCLLNTGGVAVAIGSLGKLCGREKALSGCLGTEI